MLIKLVQTDSDYIWTFLRVVVGVIIFPYGLQKVTGWFGGLGLKLSIQQITDRGIPAAIAWLVVGGQFLGGVALLLGFLTRVAAGGLFIIFAGALVVHLPDGWTMNWFGKKNGEGIEYFIMLLALLLVVILKGAGALSVDRWLQAGM
jgi:putative oxidoreductase